MFRRKCFLTKSKENFVSIPKKKKTGIYLYEYYTNKASEKNTQKNIS